MALQKSTLNINFAQGLDTKTDPFQVSPGRFLALENSVFTTNKKLLKRSGFGNLQALSSAGALSTFNESLVAVQGNSLQAYTPELNQWRSQGYINPVGLSTTSIVRSNTSQTQTDSVVLDSGLACTVYTDQVPSGGSTTPTAKYVVSDSTTGQIVTTGIIGNTSVHVTPRVFALGNYFIIVFSNTITATQHLQYIAININNPTSVSAKTDISTQYVSSTAVNFDGVVANGNLYLAWFGSDTPTHKIRMTYIKSTLQQANTTTVTSVDTVNSISVCADTSGSGPNISVVSIDSSNNVNLFITDSHLNIILGETGLTGGIAPVNAVCSATGGITTILYENVDVYGYDGSIETRVIYKLTCTQAGVTTGPNILMRSVGLASKSFIYNDNIYFLCAYNSAFQPTYFLADISGHLIVKLAYSNGAGYLPAGLPSVSINETRAQFSYLFKDLITSVNKTQGVANSAGIYSQTGVNIASVDFAFSPGQPVEIGQNWHLPGGFLWMYDGVAPSEHGFFLWPDYVEATTATTGGNLADQQYFYQAIYSWTDSRGNIHNSAPSIPITVTTAGGGTSTNTIYVPTLRLTYKTNVRIVIYRWSAVQQNYYQITSVSAPTLNDPTVDYITYIDTQSDASILGNALIYTTGGVVENIGAPACNGLTLFKSRLFLLTAEDPNLVWFSKQVIENTPVETTDLFTKFIAPTIGAQGSTGDLKALSTMDDKIIFTKSNAFLYMVGDGPDNTGSNDSFSEPIFISSTVGTSNQNSIALMPEGLMFQSNKGIWKLGRDLSTTYIGADVEKFNSSKVLSALTIPNTNQVRFTLDSGEVLMYDYYYNQWGTFTGISGVSATIYDNFHTYINALGQVRQETPGLYLDGTSPVLMKFTTGWFNLMGLQGLERAYFMYLLGQYLSPHKLSIEVAYDYDPSIAQRSIFIPDSNISTYGSNSVYGGGAVYGGTSGPEQGRMFFQTQKVQAFQLTLSEIFDSSLGISAGAGFSLSGLGLVIGSKRSFTTLKANKSFG